MTRSWSDSRGTPPSAGRPLPDGVWRLDWLLPPERESALFLEDESFYRPFALRALGLLRGEPGLIEEARARFDAMGLEWQANQTRELIEPPPQAAS